MGNWLIAATAVAALPLAALPLPTAGAAQGLAQQSFSGAQGVQVHRGIENHPDYWRSGRTGIRVFRGEPNDPPLAPTARKRTITKRASSAALVPGDRFLAAPGARNPFPYWPAWRRTGIPTHCAPRWMC